MSVCVNGFLSLAPPPSPAPSGAETAYEGWLYSSGALLAIFVINGLSSLFHTDDA